MDDVELRQPDQGVRMVSCRDAIDQQLEPSMKRMTREDATLPPANVEQSRRSLGILLIAVALLVKKNIQTVPTGLQNFFEPVVAGMAHLLARPSAAFIRLRNKAVDTIE